MTARKGQTATKGGRVFSGGATGMGTFAVDEPSERGEGRDTVLARNGGLEARIATSPADIAASQELRYQVFYREMSARGCAEIEAQQRDFDDFDKICDHLLAFDTRPPLRADGGFRVVGTYRLLRQDVADASCGFYTADEFDISPLKAKMRQGVRFLELGRSCTHKDYRTKPTIELLWKGIMAYVAMHRLDVMFGCASFEGTNPDDLAVPLSFLHHECRAPEDWRVHPLADRYVRMDRIAREDIHLRDALRALPPLIKGYVRAGAYIGEGAVVDHQFGTTDVFVVLPVEAIAARYLGHFGPAANRHAA